MIEFPMSTAVQRKIPKEYFYKHLPSSKALKEKFVSDVDKFVIENSLKKQNLNLVADSKIEEIILLSVYLKKKDYECRIIEAIAKQNPHKLVFLIQYEGDSQLALCHNSKLYRTEWMKSEDINLKLQGFSLDEIWENFVGQIALSDERVKNTDNLSLDERLALQDKIVKLEKLIKKTEEAMWKEAQPKKKYDLHTRLLEYKRELEDLKSSSKIEVTDG